MFFSIFQALQDLDTLAPLQTLNYRKNMLKVSDFRESLATFCKMQNTAEFCQISKFQLDNLVDFKKC